MLSSTVVIRHDQKKWIATAMVALSGILYGFLGYLGTRVIESHMAISAMLFWRFFIASCWMSIFIFLNPERKLAHHRDWLGLVAIGVLVYSTSSAFYFLASRQIGTGPAMVVFFSFPIFVAIFSLIKGDSALSRVMVGALAGVCAGLLLLKGSGLHALNVLGLIFSLIGSLGYAIYVFMNRNVTLVISAEKFTFLICAGNSLLFLILALSRGKFSYPASAATWSNVIMLGVLATAIPIQLFLRGMQVISPIKASILSVLEPAVTLIVGVMMFHEAVTSFQLLGVLVIIVSALLAQCDWHARGG